VDNLRIALRLRRARQVDLGMFAFVVGMENCGGRRILVPYPAVTGLRFESDTRQSAQWLSQFLGRERCDALVLNPSQFVWFELPLFTSEQRRNGDAIRSLQRSPWCIDTEPETWYKIYFVYAVGAQNVGNVAVNLSDLHEEADRRRATLWDGRIESTGALELRERTDGRIQKRAQRCLEDAACR
jgi:hypothetical protein